MRCTRNVFTGMHHTTTMSIEVQGLDDLSDELERFQRRLEEVGGDIPMEDLFTDGFMLAYTDCDSLEAFFAASPWTVESQADFEAIPAAEFDEYVDAQTDFDSWEAMVRAGVREYILRQAE